MTEEEKWYSIYWLQYFRLFETIELSMGLRKIEFILLLYDTILFNMDFHNKM